MDMLDFGTGANLASDVEKLFLFLALNLILSIKICSYSSKTRRSGAPFDECAYFLKVTRNSFDF
jgi:hypothetical protein